MPEEIFILILVSIVAVLMIIRAGLKHDREVRTARYAAQAAQAALPAMPDAGRDVLAAKVDRLEQRLAVLERITIDPSHRLAAEIDDLALPAYGRERTEA